MGDICSGLRVVDFSSWMAGPLATVILADYGADVIKIEPPWGDPARALPAFQTWNRGKRSVHLDLKTDSGRAAALDLAGAADVVVTSWRPGVAERLGLDYDTLRLINPRVIYASITGYGEMGKRRRLKGYEALVAAKSGRTMMFEGVAERPGPAFPAVPCASYSAAMLTLQGILAALHMRRRTAQGQKVSISLISALMPFDMVMWIGWQLRGAEMKAQSQPAPMVLQRFLGERTQAVAVSSGSRTYDPARLHRPEVRVPRPNYLVAVTKDGVWLQFANTIDRLCVAQMRVLDLLDLYGDERFAKLPAVFTEDDADRLWEIVLERVRSRTYPEWEAAFQAYEDLAVERHRWPTESLQHRQVVHNGHVVEVPGLNGQTTLQPGPIVRIAGAEAFVGRRAPYLGEHTREVLREPCPRAEPRAPTPSVATEPPSAPLAGITIVDFSTWIAAPYSTALLADLGARVVKVEQVGGDTSRYSTGGLLSFPMTQGKESIALDLKDPRGREIAHRLIAAADGVVHNYRTGVAERLGIDYESCRRLNPRIIYLNEASYGDAGPDNRRPAFFATIAAIGGNALRQVGEGHPPAASWALSLEELKHEAWRLLKAAEGNADPIASLAAAAAFLLGLHAREETGSSQSLLTTMVCANIWANSDEAIVYEGRPPLPRVDADLMGLGPAYRLYPTAQGWIFLACANKVEWQAFCRLLGKEDLGSLWPKLSREEADGVVQEVVSCLAQRSAAEWEQLAAQEDVPLVAVEERDPGRFNIEDEEMRRWGHVAEVTSPVHGTYWRHGALQRFSDASQIFGPWEPLGGHTIAILQDLGYNESEIEVLLREGVVEAWSTARDDDRGLDQGGR